MGSGLSHDLLCASKRISPIGRHPLVEFAVLSMHVIARGNWRAPIFHGAVDYTAYLERDCHRDGVTLHAYVFMTRPATCFRSDTNLSHFLHYPSLSCRCSWQCRTIP